MPEELRVCGTTSYATESKPPSPREGPTLCPSSLNTHEWTRFHSPNESGVCMSYRDGEPRLD